jgi:hypothetical protein
MVLIFLAIGRQTKKVNRGRERGGGEGRLTLWCAKMRRTRWELQAALSPKRSTTSRTESDGAEVSISALPPPTAADTGGDEEDSGAAEAQCRPPCLCKDLGGLLLLRMELRTTTTMATHPPLRWLDRSSPAGVDQTVGGVKAQVSSPP